MTTSVVTNKDTNTVNFSYSGKLESVTGIINAAAHYLFNVSNSPGEDGLTIAFSALTDKDKLNLIDKHIERVITDMAYSYTISAALEVARDTAVIDAKTKVFDTNSDV